MLGIPHYKQSTPDTCLPACVRMVLAHLGKVHDEHELAQVMGTVRGLGTNPENAIVGLERIGYRALWFENATFERLNNLLQHEWPVIVFVRAADLPHGRAGLHAIVLIAMTADQVTCLDPSLDEPLNLALPAFLSTWTALGSQGMVVWIA